MAVNPLTTTTTVGVVTRYAITIIGAVVSAVAVLGWVEQATADNIMEQVNILFGAISALVAIGIPIYAALTKSNSDRASEVANEVDAKVSPQETVVVQTPAGQADIIVPPKE
jgi:hypothetical protein